MTDLYPLPPQLQSDFYLQRLQESQIEWARELHNDPEVLEMLTDPHVVSAEEQVVWFEKLCNSRSSLRWVVAAGNTPMGLVRLDQIDTYNKSVCVGLDIHKDFRGMGLAKPTYRRVLDAWFNIFNFNRAWLLVASYNKRALHIYQSLGFVHEGIQREALLKNGVFHDYHMLSILKKDWK